MFWHKSKLLVGIKAGTLVLVSLPKCDPWSLVFIAMDSTLYASMNVVDYNMPCVCENVSIGVYPHNCDDILHESMGVVTLEEKC